MLTLVNALYNNDVDCIIINESYRAMIEEDFPNFSSDTRVIYSKQYVTEINSPENSDITRNTLMFMLVELIHMAQLQPNHALMLI